jgi:hypothetical protein
VGFLSTLAHGLVEPTFPGQQYVVIFWIFTALVYLYQRLVEQSELAVAIAPIPLSTQLKPNDGVHT